MRNFRGSLPQMLITSIRGQQNNKIAKFYCRIKHNNGIQHISSNDNSSVAIMLIVVRTELVTTVPMILVIQEKETILFQ